jgi:hypothetical protein
MNIFIIKKYVIKYAKLNIYFKYGVVSGILI